MYATLDSLLEDYPAAQYAVTTPRGWQAAHNIGTARILAAAFGGAIYAPHGTKWVRIA